MGTYRIHTLSVEDLYKKAGRETEKKKSPIWADAAIEEHYWSLCALLDIFCYFYWSVLYQIIPQFPAQGWWGPSRVRIPSIGSWLTSGTGGVGALNFHISKHPSPCFAPGVFFTFLLFEGASPHFAISCSWTITSLRATLCCCARRKNVNLNKPPSQWYLKTDCRISSRFCKALFKNNSYIFIFQLVNREFF